LRKKLAAKLRHKEETGSYIVLRMITALSVCKLPLLKCASELDLKDPSLIKALDTLIKRSEGDLLKE